jgi:hypothetical protein
MAEAEEDVIEVFKTREQMAAQAAIDEVLGPLGIDSYIHNRVSHALPAPATMEGGYFIAVPRDRATEAVQALTEALSDGAIDGELTLER